MHLYADLLFCALCVFFAAEFCFVLTLAAGRLRQRSIDFGPELLPAGSFGFGQLCEGGGVAHAGQGRAQFGVGRAPCCFVRSPDCWLDARPAQNARSPLSQSRACPRSECLGHWVALSHRDLRRPRPELPRRPPGGETGPAHPAQGAGGRRTRRHRTGPRQHTGRSGEADRASRTRSVLRPRRPGLACSTSGSLCSRACSRRQRSLCQ